MHLKIHFFKCILNEFKNGKIFPRGTQKFSQQKVFLNFFRHFLAILNFFYYFLAIKIDFEQLL
jgi:hypothetical protein